MPTETEFRPPGAPANWLDNPEFDCAGRVHDWRNHVGERVKALWPTFTREQKLAIAEDADDSASNEDWD